MKMDIFSLKVILNQVCLETIISIINNKEDYSPNFK